MNELPSSLKETYARLERLATELAALPDDGSPQSKAAQQAELLRVTEALAASTSEEPFREAAACLRCGSEQVLLGDFDSRSFGASFTPEGMKVFTLSLFSPSVTIVQQAHVCARCGFLWSTVDVDELHSKIRTWGTNRLKRQLYGGQEGAGSAGDLPRPGWAPEPDVSALPRPAPGTEDP